MALMDGPDKWLGTNAESETEVTDMDDELTDESDEEDEDSNDEDSEDDEEPDSELTDEGTSK